MQKRRLFIANDRAPRSRKPPCVSAILLIEFTVAQPFTVFYSISRLLFVRTASAQPSNMSVASGKKPSLAAQIAALMHTAPKGNADTRIQLYSLHCAMLHTSAACVRNGVAACCDGRRV